jgi:DNA-binding CsgD family transcriptional regulator
MTNLSPHEPLDPALGSTLLETGGHSGFADAVLTAAHSLSGVEEVFAYRVGEDGHPCPLIASSMLHNFAERSGHYARSFYRDDPAVRIRQSAQRGSGFANQICATQIERRDYRKLCFDEPGFVDKLCYGWRGDTLSLVLSFYRKHDNDARAFQRLAGLADVTLAALFRDIKPKAADPLITRLEARLLDVFPTLTLRENQVSARTIAGWTADQTAASLGIKLGTVLTYRQRAYQRLGFSRATDFLDAIVD